MDQNNNKTKLKVGIRVTDMLIGACISLICFAAFSFIENVYVRFGIIIWIIIIGIISYVIYCLNVERNKVVITDTAITKIALLNEENKPIKEWDLLGQVSVIIGKSTNEEKVYIDLNNSIYSPLIDNNHAVLNYADGSWFVEDLSSEKGVSIQKVEDNEKYNIVKGSPCTIRKGDVIYISKVKLLLE